MPSKSKKDDEPISRNVNTTLEIRGNLRKLFSDKTSTEIIADGPAGTGKTRIILERQNLIQNKYPLARGLIIRKFRSSMNTTCLQVLKDDVFKDQNGNAYPDAPEWHERDQEFVYSNGSKIVVSGMDDPTKVMSSQYDWFYWNEAIEAKRAEWENVMSRLRNFKVPYQQAIGDTNPGPPTHWIKKFADAGKIQLYPTNHKDNPVYWDDKKQKWTAKGEMYVNRTLRDGLTGLRNDRLYKGLWKSAEGLVYDAWNVDVHVVPRWTLPASWPRYWMFDFGYVDPFVWLELVQNPNTGQIILYRELYHTGLRVEEACNIIKEKSYGIKPMFMICDHDAENRATLEKEFGWLTLPAYKSINPGIEAVKSRLVTRQKWSTDDTEVPGFVVMENPGIKIDKDLQDRHKPLSTVDEFDAYVWDTGKIALDKYKDLPIDRDNHGMDAVRYGIAFLDDIAIDPQERTMVIPYNDFDEDEEYMHDMEVRLSEF